MGLVLYLKLHVKGFMISYGRLWIIWDKATTVVSRLST
jgi:hypothetical protein